MKSWISLEGLVALGLVELGVGEGAAWASQTPASNLLVVDRQVEADEETDVGEPLAVFGVRRWSSPYPCRSGRA